MKIDTIVTGEIETNTYIIHDENCGNAIVIDPGDDMQTIDFLTREGLFCTDILITHGHFDHVYGVKGLVERFGAKVYIGARDAAGLYDSDVNLSYLDDVVVPPSKADVLLKDGDVLDLNGIRFDVIETPGHSAGGVCYVIESEKVIFTGDTLFRLGYGRTDIKNADFGELVNSIINKLFALEGDYTVYPGHMRPSAMAAERLHNLIFRAIRERV